MITVIEQTTAERNKETSDLFLQIRPLLDEGYSYHSALMKIKRINKHSKAHYYGQAWFKELKKYGESQGYSYGKYSGKGHKRA